MKGENRERRKIGEGERGKGKRAREKEKKKHLALLPHDTNHTRKTSTSLLSIDPMSISLLSEFHCATLQEERYREEGNEGNEVVD